MADPVTVSSIAVVIMSMSCWARAMYGSFMVELAREMWSICRVQAASAAERRSAISDRDRFGS